LLICEATRDLPVAEVAVRTPLEATTGHRLKHELVLVPVLRAGLGMMSGILQFLPGARVGFIGLRRDESTLQPVAYHDSVPARLGDAEVIVIDPMLATGGSSLAALDLLHGRGARRVRLINLVSCPEGVRAVRQRYPKLPLFTASIDRELNGKGYILPGLGDAGDRLFHA